MVIIPLTPDPFKLGWVKEGDGLFPLLSQVQAALEAVAELIHPVCRKMHLQESPSQVTDLCKFEGNKDCCNTNTAVIDVDDLSKKWIFSQNCCLLTMLTVIFQGVINELRPANHLKNVLVY